MTVQPKLETSTRLRQQDPQKKSMLAHRPCTANKVPKLFAVAPSGFEEVLVHNIAEIAAVNPVTQIARIGHTVGKKKRIELIAVARKLNLKIVNVKEVKEPAAEAEAAETEATASEAAKDKKAEKKSEKKPQKANKSKGAKKQ
jgi:hypothetical protein